MANGIRGLSLSNGCWLAQVKVDGVRHRKTFGKATPENAAKAVAWLDALRAGRTATLPAGTAREESVGVATSGKAIAAYAARQARQAVTMAERIAANKKAYARRK